MILLAIIGLLIIVVAVARLYVRYSISSLKGAARAWDDVVIRTEAVLSRPYPREVKDLAYGMFMSAGCGCFALAFVKGHVLSRTATTSDSGAGSQLKAILAKLDNSQRKRIDELVVAIIAYDALSRPFLSLLFGFGLKRPKASESVKSVEVARAVRAESQVRSDIRNARAVVVKVAQSDAFTLKAARSMAPKDFQCGLAHVA